MQNTHSIGTIAGTLSAGSSDRRRNAPYLGASCVLAAVLAVGSPPPLLSAEVAAAPAFDSRANTTGLPDGEAPWWPSRYGADDQIGTLNEITPEVVRAAAALLKTGTVVDLGRVLDEETLKFPGRYWHQTLYVKMGLFGLENLATERLTERGVHEFLLVLTHAETRGSSAAVVAPAAVF